MAGTLFLVATPIGNLEDITLRALRILKEVKLVAAEDTRTAQNLLRHYGIEAHLVSYHEHNKDRREAMLLDALAEGDIALISEAGMPAVSDPGYELVEAAWASGFRVSPIPGPSAPIAALAASGLPTDRFLYLGFVPRRHSDRLLLLQEIAPVDATLVCFETPHRLRESIGDMLGVLGNRPMAAARELTKLHEEIWRGTLVEFVKKWEDQEPRGEFTLVIGGPSKKRKDKGSLNDALNLAFALESEGIPLSQAVRAVAKALGISRRKLYQAAQESRKFSSDSNTAPPTAPNSR